MRFIAKPIQSKDVLDALLQQLKSYTGFARRNVLIVQSDPERLKRIEECIDGAEDLRITSVADGGIALQAVREQALDCLVVDPSLPGLDPVALVDEIQRRSPDFAVTSTNRPRSLRKT